MIRLTAVTTLISASKLLQIVRLLALAYVIYAYYTSGTPLGITKPADLSINLAAYANGSNTSAVDVVDATGVKQYL
jgi:hypothetical protein